MNRWIKQAGNACPDCGISSQTTHQISILSQILSTLSHTLSYSMYFIYAFMLGILLKQGVTLYLSNSTNATQS